MKNPNQHIVLFMLLILLSVLGLVLKSLINQDNNSEDVISSETTIEEEDDSISFVEASTEKLDSLLPEDIDVIPYIDEDYLRRKGVMFPFVNMGIFLLETSFCKCNYSDGRASACCAYRWENEIGFSPNNPFSIKHNDERETLSQGSIMSIMPMYTTSETPWWILDYSHSKLAVYNSIDDSVKDLVLWQGYLFNKYGQPNSNKEYIDILEKSSHNNFSDYFLQLRELTQDRSNFYNNSLIQYRLNKYYDEIQELNNSSDYTY